MTDEEKMNQLEKVTNVDGLLDYMHTNYDNVNELIDKYNDISISVQVIRKDLRKKEITLETVKIMKEYFKDTSKPIHVVVNNYYKK